MDSRKNLGTSGSGEEVAGIVARVVSQAVHDALLNEDMTKSAEGQNAIANALLDFAKILAKHHFRGVDRLIEASQLARDARHLFAEGDRRKEA